MATLIDIVTKDATDRSVTIRIIDSSDGTPETGVVFNTSGIDLWYRREGAAKVSITEADLATPALTDAHADGGFLHIGDGEYRLDLPDAAFATGANHVDVGGVVTGMVVIGGRVRLVDYDPEDTVRLGLTALPNAAAEAAGGLYTRGTGAGQINQPANGQVDANIVALGGGTQSADDLKDFADAGYDPSTNKVEGVKLVDTTTTNTDMRGTDSALLAANVPTNFAALGINASGHVLRVTLTDTTTTNTDMRGTDSASTHSAADVWSVGTRVLTAGTNIALAKGTGVTGFNDLSAADVNAEVDTALADINLDHLMKIAVDTNFATTVHLDSVIGQLADVGSAATFDRTTDSLEAIRVQGDSAWITATGFSTLDAAGVRTAVGLASANLDTQLNAIVTDTNELQTDWANGGRLDLILDAILADTAAFGAAGSLPGQGAPSATATPLQQLAYLFKAWRNKTTQTSSEYNLFADDGTTVDQQASTTDDGTTMTRGEVATGP